MNSNFNIVNEPYPRYATNAKSSISRVKKDPEISVRRNESSIYWKYNQGARSVVNLSLKQFKDIEAPVVVCNGHKCKFRGCTRADAMDVFRRALESFGLDRRHKLMFEEERVLNSSKMTNRVDERPLSRVEEEDDEIPAPPFSYTAQSFDLLRSKVSDLERVLKLSLGAFRITSFVTSLFSSLLSFFSPQSSVNRPIFALHGCLQLLVSALSMLDNFCVLTAAQFALAFFRLVTDTFYGQSFEDLTYAAISMMLPPKLWEVVKRMQVFTSAKIGEEDSWFNSVLEWIADVVSVCADVMQRALPEWARAFVDLLRSWFLKRKILADAKRVIDESKKKDAIMDPFLRDRIKQVRAQWVNQPSLVDWCRKSPFIQSVYNRVDLLSKQVLAMENIQRVEPSMFIFEGPPGCGKSVAMSLLVKLMNMPAYAHNVKAAQDGKDFYDTYQNEPIMYMDDVGQQGKSQWRFMINVVSSVVYKLDCAAAEKKDTKIFDSPLIFATTNQFMSLSGFTPNDCVANEQALHRRGLVFDFANLVFREGKWTGRASFKRYDLFHGVFVENFHPEVREYFRDKNIPVLPSIELDLASSRTNLLSWLYMIVKGYYNVKGDHKVANTLSDDEISEVRALDALFEAQVKEIQCYPTFDDDDDLDTLIENERIFCNLVRDFMEENNDVTYQQAVTYVKSSLSDTGVNRIQELRNEKYMQRFAEKVAKESDVEVVEDIDFTDAAVKLSPFVGYASDYSLRGFGELIAGSTSSWDFKTQDWILSVIGVVFFLAYIIYISYHVVSDGLYLGKKAYSGVKSVARSVSEFFSPKDFRAQVIDLVAPYSTESAHTSVKAIADMVFIAQIQTTDRTVVCCSLVSGHFVLLPSHMFSPTDVLVLTLFNSNNVIVLDHIRVEEVFRDVAGDLVIVEIPRGLPSYFKNKSHFFKNSSAVCKSPWLITPVGTIPLLHSVKPMESVIKYTHARTGYENELARDSRFVYDHLQMPGFCGSILFDALDGVLGFHVGGNNVYDVGFSIIWSQSLKNKVQSILETDSFLSDVSPKLDNQSNISGIKLDKKMFVNTNNLSSIVKSPLFSVLPVSKEPADLRKFGPHTVKDVAKKSFSPVSDIPVVELKFAAKVLSALVPEFDVISEKEVILGNEHLARLNKDSSNGYGFKPGKDVYIDYERGEYKADLREKLGALEQNILNENFVISEWIWTEALKDETRAFSKNGVPRSFRIGPLALQVKTKEIFGEMVAKIIDAKWSNQIMIGINPYVDWQRLYDTMSRSPHVWDGDIGSYDGKMPAQVQQLLVDCFSTKFTGSAVNKKIMEFLSYNMIMTPLALNDDLWSTTHSMPSGCFLTAIGNSLIHRVYTAMWYHRNLSAKGVIPTLSGFFEDVIDFVYGDDGLNGVYRHSDVLNAITMREFYESLGMTFTDALKRPIESPFLSIEELSFLKRTFEYHPHIKRVMCPLALSTIYSTLSYYDKSKDVDDVMRDKINAFQRELYLHSNIDFDSLVGLVLDKAEELHLPCKRLTKAYLHLVYTDPVEMKSLRWSSYDPGLYV